MEGQQNNILVLGVIPEDDQISPACEEANSVVTLHTGADLPQPLRHNQTSLLSALYAFILVLVGLVMPVTEALTSQWLTSHFIGVFNVYLYLGATLFLVYVQVFHVYLPSKEPPREEPKPSVEQYDGAFTPNPVSNTSTPKPRVRRVALHNLLPNKPTKSTTIDYLQDRISSTSDLVQGEVEEDDQPEEPKMHRKSCPASPFSVESTPTSQGMGTRKHSLIMGDAMKAVRRRCRKRSQIASPQLTGQVYDNTEDLHDFLAMKHGTASFSHEATSFYMRLGVLLFAIGNLIYLGLQIEYILGLHKYKHCPGVREELDYPYYFWLIFILVQTFFLFKNRDLMVRAHKPLVRFGLMHVAATNMCIWIRVLVFEVMEAIHESQHQDDDHFASSIGQLYDEAAPTSGDNLTECDNFQPLLNDLSPILFPFVLEYSLVGAAAMMAMYESIDFYLTKGIMEVLKNAVKRSHHIHQIKLQKFHAVVGEHGEEESLSKSHTGMYFGFVVLAGTVVSIILSMYWANRDREWDSDLTFLITDLLIGVMMLVTTLAAMVQFRKLGYASSRDNMIDAVLLFTSYAGLFLLELYTFVASAEAINAKGISTYLLLDSICAIIHITQGSLQVIFIIDGMHRYVVFANQMIEKPGREVVTFLIVVNVSTWLFKTIQEKQLAVSDEHLFFGDIAWSIILNLSLPLVLFFRFHSSICLAHIWHSAYVREEDPFSPEDLAEDIVKDLQTRL